MRQQSQGGGAPRPAAPGGIALLTLPRLGGEGRVLALEVLRATPAVQSAVRDGKNGTLQSAMQSGKREGMIPLDRCLADLVLARKVTLEDARAAASDPAVLASYLSG